MKKVELKLVPDTEIKYYKEVIQPWTQPILTEDGVIDGAYFACQMLNNPVNKAYLAFDGNTGTNARISSGASTESQYIFYNPNPLKISQIIINGTGNSNNEFMSAGILYGSNDKQEWVELAAFEGISYTDYVLEVNSTGFYKYHKFMPLKLTTSGYWTIAELTITAEEKVTVECSEKEATISTSVPIIKGLPLMKKNKHYYKIEYRPWDKPGRPYLTSNTSDPDFIVSADAIYDGTYQIYYSFYYNSGGTPWHAANNGKPHWYQIDFRKPIRITRIDMRNRSSQYGSSSDTTYTIVARNSEDEEWVKLTPTIQNTVTANDGRWFLYPAATKGYKQYRFELGYGSIGFPTFVWEEEYKQPCLETDDYDGYDEVIEYTYTGVAYPELKYFRRGSEPNISVAGTLNFNDGIMSGFSKGNYAYLPKCPQGTSSYEVQIKFKLNTFNDGRLLGDTHNNVYSPQIEVKSGATASDWVALHPNSAHSAWFELSLGAFPQVELGKWYWLRQRYDEKYYYVYLSTDGDNFQLVGYKEATNSGFTGHLCLGADINAYFVDGEYDLKDCYVKLDNKMWWRGTFPEECSEEEAEWSEWVNADKPIN